MFKFKPEALAAVTMNMAIVVLAVAGILLMVAASYGQSPSVFNAGDTDTEGNINGPPKSTAITASGSAATGGLKITSGFLHTKEGGAVGASTQRSASGQEPGAVTDQPAPTAILWVTERDPQKPTWYHYSRKADCLFCRKAEHLMLDKRMVGQSQHWNCVWVEVSGGTVPADEFESPLIRREAFRIAKVGCPSSAMAYAYRLYDAWFQVHKEYRDGSYATNRVSH